MSSEDQLEHVNRREFTRLRSSAECVCLFAGKESRAVLADASRGGCKLRFDEPDMAMAALLPVPCDIVIRDEESVMPATVMWANGDLAGCRFQQPLSLDEVSRLLGGRFRLEVLREPEGVSTPRAHIESRAEAEARQEAEMAAAIRRMVEAED
ncbi:conserved protein of unknown function (PilZ domain-like 5-105) [Magnetospirillum sp. XM-1]|uniref:PilZ domain-containing protein n=1 Tax=Magnetospirillum sp. XM-1 TaxID=1663591 RepID=UPI00073DC650|nr:PilZ domain-containing protein [Magnetospirillum sp. XM-1]CUW41355.1 conserved protein of unknown function (PilZ domain-like 5-105) [Magnetospirillum sp. XM-1]